MRCRPTKPRGASRRATCCWSTSAPPTSATLAPAPVAFRTLDDNGLAALEALPKDTAIAFLCHHGNRSAQAAEHFRQRGFRDLHNVIGGTEAWSDVDPSVPRY